MSRVDPVSAFRSCPIVRRGALAYEVESRRIWWRDTPVELSETERGMMRQLIRRRRVSYEEIDANLVKLRASPANRSVFLWRIKEKFAHAGLPTPFRRIEGLGLELVVEPDGRGSTSLIIGDTLHGGQVPARRLVRTDRRRLAA